MTTFETFVETEAVVPLSRLRNTHVVFKIRWNHEFFVLVSVQILGLFLLVAKLKTEI
ncbi:hypothetical protein IGJ83_001021 [Enterococcus pernyi]|nr:hypothetical protein UAC_02054 [Enterococcus mundtii ATCC 882]EOU12255.1 hypothetical protein I587_00783 [Enterococcus mundtii ATCC 882]